MCDFELIAWTEIVMKWTKRSVLSKRDQNDSSDMPKKFRISDVQVPEVNSIDAIDAKK